MANIKISDLRPAGSDLFSDPESYINELSEGEFAEVIGGGSGWFCEAVVGAAISAMSVPSVVVAASVASWITMEGQAY